MYEIKFIHKDETTENTLYTPGSSTYCLLSAKLKLECGKAGELTLGVPDVNPAKADFVCLTDEILVYRDGEELWRGRAITREEDFYKTGTPTCEGVLAYLYDTYYPPFEFSGSPTDFLAAVLDNHNAQVEERKRIYLGNVTVEDNNDYIARSSIEYNRTLTVLTDKLINDSLGGYFRVRIDGGIKYLDYLTSYDTTATQPVAFGENLLDIAQNVEYSDLATVILPLGAKLEDSDGNQTDEYLTIADVNGGSIYYADETAVAEYGWIVVCNIWDDVTEASNLLTKAKNYLAQVTSAVSSFEVNAVDLALISSDYAPINLGDMVLIQSEPHGVNQYVELTSLTIDLLDPSNDTLTFGADTATLTDSQRSSSRSVQAALESLSVRYTNLVATVITTNYLTANYITANDIAAKYVTADTLTANYVKTSYLTANYITASDIAAKYVTTDILTANYITATDIAAKYVTTDTLTANYITASDIEAKYATIDLANVSVADVGTLFANVGLLTNMTVVDGSVTGALNGVTINADVITAGTLSVDRLLLTGEGGIVYAINASSSGLTETELSEEQYQNYINGTCIVAQSITANQIAAETITSNEIASNAITTAKLAANAVTAAKIAAGTITATQIAANTITGDNIAADTITADNLSVDKLSAITGNVGILTAGILQSSNYDADTGAGLLIDLDNGTITGSDLTLLATQISNISVGGRNYLTGTRDFDSDTWGKSSNVTLAADDEGYTVATWAATSALGWNNVYSQGNPLQFSTVRGQNVVLSFDVRSDDYGVLNSLTDRGLAVAFDLCTASSLTRTLYHAVYFYTTELSDEWQRITVAATLTDDYFTSGSGTIDDTTRFYVRIYNYSLYAMQVRKVKLELGTVATDWTPAPEDTDDQISAKLALTVDDNRVATISGNADRIELTSGQLVITSDNFSLTEDGTIAANAGTVGPLIITNSADTDNETGHYTDVSAMMQSYGTTVTALDTTEDTTRTVTVDMEWGLKSCGTSSTNAVMYLCVKKPKDDWSSSTAPRLFSLTGRGHLKCSGLEVFPTRALDVSDYGTDEESIALADDEVRCAYTDNAYLHFNSVKFDAQSVYSDIDPVYSNTYDLGGSDYYWRRVYCDTIYRNSTASTSSDRKLKQNITALDDRYDDFIMGLNPVSFEYKDGDSHRKHLGFIAQDVHNLAMDTVGDLALFKAQVIGDDRATYQEGKYTDEQLKWGLSYEEFVPLAIKMLQDDRKRIEQLESALEAIKTTKPQ